MEDFGVALVRAMPALVVVIFYVWLLWFVLNRVTRFNDHEELFVKNNFAYLLQRMGLCFAQVIAMLAVIPDFDVDHPWESSGWLLLEGLWVFIALFTARYVIDAVLLYKVNNQALLLQGNVSIGIVEAAFYVGLGFLLNGSLTGTADTFWLSIASTVVFYIIGLAFVTGVFWIHELVTPYSLRERLQSADHSAAIELAGVLLSASIVTSVGVAGDFTSWGEGLLWFAVTALVSIGLLYLVRWLTSVVIIGRHSLKDGQRAQLTTIAGFQAGMMVLAAVVVSTVISSVV